MNRPSEQDGDLWTFGMFWRFGAFTWIYRAPAPILGDGWATVTIVDHFGQVLGRSLIHAATRPDTPFAWLQDLYIEHREAIDASQAKAHLGHPKTWRPPVQRFREHYNQHERTAA